MHVVYLTEDHPMETLFVNYLKRALSFCNLTILRLSHDIHQFAFIKFDVVIIPFTPGCDTPLGKFVQNLLRASRIVLAANWRGIDKVSEQQYRKNHIKSFSNLGLKFLSWTKRTDEFLSKLLPCGDYIRLTPFYISEVELLPNITSDSQFAFLIEFQERYWSENVREYKICSGYSPRTLKSTVEQQKKLEKRLKNFIINLSSSPKVKDIRIYTLSANAFDYWAHEIEAVSDTVSVKLLTKHNINLFLNTPIKVLCEPIFGLEEGLSVIKLSDKDFDSVECRGVAGSADLVTSEAVIHGRKSHREEVDSNDLMRLRNHIKNLDIKVRGQRLNRSIMLQYFFIQLVFYGLKNRISDSGLRIALPKRVSRT